MKTSCFSFHFKEYMVNARLEVRPVFCFSIIDSSFLSYWVDRSYVGGLDMESNRNGSIDIPQLSISKHGPSFLLLYLKTRNIWVGVRGGGEGFIVESFENAFTMNISSNAMIIKILFYAYNRPQKFIPVC